MENQKKILVTGASGFIGHHLVRLLKKQGYWVRGVDIKYPEYSKIEEADEFLILDLRYYENCLKATEGIDEVYALAADMGGMGYLSSNNSVVLHNNILINTLTLEAVRLNKVKRYFYSSSACVYPEYKQQSPSIVGLKEEDALPAQPQDAYGWEKLLHAFPKIEVHHAADSVEITLFARQIVNGRKSDQQPAHLARRPLHDHETVLDVFEIKIANAPRHVEGVTISRQLMVQYQPLGPHVAGIT